MAANYSKNKGRKGNGRFMAIPHNVLNHPDYLELRGGAVKLLNELARQYNGRNNGDLTVAYSLLKDRGFKSKDTITNAKNELVEAGLIVLTRHGKFMNPGAKCDLYALTWLEIDECPEKDLEVSPTSKPYRAFSLDKPCPESGPGSDQKSGRERKRDEKGRYVSS